MHVNSNYDRTLIAVATYNEANNINELIDRIRASCGSKTNILVVDDNSPDGTSGIVDFLQEKDLNLHLVQRISKLGLGSAHKLIFAFAIANDYEYVVTLDADLSHRPEEITKLLNQSGPNRFVIGSRYIEGGSSDYSGWRRIVSRIGNYLARLVISTDLRELTTSFRVFSTECLKQLPICDIKANGYAFFVEVVYYLTKLDVELIEVPISFQDRKNDISKIPRSQIVFSVLSLVRLLQKRFINERSAEIRSWLKVCCCRYCGNDLLILRYEGVEQYAEQNLESNKFSCSSVLIQSDLPAVYDCLSCGLAQVSVDTYPKNISNYYIDCEDKEYLNNKDVKEKTFAKALKNVEIFFPNENKRRILDIGCYFGVFLNLFNKSKYERLGIEPSEYATNYCVNQLGIEVFRGDLETYSAHNTAKERFDIITTWDVLEHVDNPSEFLSIIHELLHNRGCFVFSTILIDSLVARILGRRWPWILPMHVTYFDETTLSKILSDTGFEVINSGNHVHYARLSYIFSACSTRVPRPLKDIALQIAKVLPASLSVPVALGDVRMYVCRKKT